MDEQPAVAETDAPQFCPWCGAPAPFRTEPHTPSWQRIADERGEDAPAALEDALHTDAFVTGCPGCKRISHVIGHKAQTT